MSDLALTVSNLTKTYQAGSETVTAVDGVSFGVDRGSIVGVLGPNGAGKTTTIKLCLGLITPTAGHVEVHGVDPHANPRSVYTNVSAVLEGARNVYWRLTVRENLRFFAGCHGIHPDDPAEQYDRLLSTVGLADKADEEVRNLSRGMKQKASLACVLIRQTPLLFLDEPTLGLDVEAAVDLKREIRRLATEEGRTVVLSSHDMAVVEALCDRVLIMDDGSIVADDTVEHLTEMFDTTSYRLTFAPSEGPDGALAEFQIRQVARDGHHTVEVVLADNDQLYDVIEACRDAGATIERIESVDPDLEDVFLTTIGDEDRPTERARPGDT